MTQLPEEELKFIAQAKAYLEHPSWMIRLVNLVGQPIELATKKLPDRIQGTIARASTTALTKALEVSLKTVPAYVDRSFEVAAYGWRIGCGCGGWVFWDAFATFGIAGHYGDYAALDCECGAGVWV